MKLSISTDLTLPIEAVTQTFAILAKRGVGKTYTGCVMVEEMLRLGQQVVIVDPVGVWWGLRSSADGQAPGFPIVVFGGERGDVPLDENAGEVVAQAIIENGFSAVLDLSLFRKAAQNRFMLAFAETLYRLNRKPLHLMVDEADEFAPQRPLKGNERLLGAFEDIVRRGRARGLGVTLITQRAAVLNKNVLTQIEVLVVLRTISPQDREAIEAWTEIHGTTKQLEQLSETMASLPIGTAWFWSPGWLNIFQKIKVRAKTTFDSSATPKVGDSIKKPKALAEVNLEKLGAQIQATAESAKANDPVELRRQIAGLKKELNAKAKVQPLPAKTVVKEVSTLTSEDRRIIDDTASICSDAILKFEGIRSRINEAVLQLASLVSRFPYSKPPQPAHIDKNGVFHSANGAPDVRRPVSTSSSKPEGRSQNREFSGGKKRMLIALAQRSPLSKKQLGVRAGLSSSSGTFGTYLGQLRADGLVDGGGDGLEITEAGKLALGAFEPLPEGTELLNYWLRELGDSGTGRMLRCLADAFPKAITKEELGLAAEISHTSGTFGTYLGKLRALELVDKQAGNLRASQEFFV